MNTTPTSTPRGTAKCGSGWSRDLGAYSALKLLCVRRLSGPERSKRTSPTITIGVPVPALGEVMGNPQGQEQGTGAPRLSAFTALPPVSHRKVGKHNSVSYVQQLSMAGDNSRDSPLPRAQEAHVNATNGPFYGRTQGQNYPLNSPHGASGPVINPKIDDSILMSIKAKGLRLLGSPSSTLLLPVVYYQLWYGQDNVDLERYSQWSPNADHYAVGLNAAVTAPPGALAALLAAALLAALGVGSMGWASSGSSYHSISDALSNRPSGPRAGWSVIVVVRWAWGLRSKCSNQRHIYRVFTPAILSYVPPKVFIKPGAYHQGYHQENKWTPYLTAANMRLSYHHPQIGGASPPNGNQIAAILVNLIMTLKLVA
ncbi:hypothetical protein H4582DRAFT_2067261 [Lactarius indigo]|nr:hypothetical protein H4582DRAFT_2067261 [Lactarius indigo]